MNLRSLAGIGPASRLRYRPCGKRDVADYSPFVQTGRPPGKTEEGHKADPSALKQLDVIRKLLNQAGSVIICTDAAREGELIARYVLEYLGYTKETKRLWISSLTENQYGKVLIT